MSTNQQQYLNSGPSFIHEDVKRKLSPDVEPQYVHHLAPKPSPEIEKSITGNKDIKQRCVKFTVGTVICLLLLLLVAGILLAYYYSSSCVHGMHCGDGSCIWESEWCNGVRDCPAGQDEANCVRLHGSSFLLQIYWTQTRDWRLVCSHGWSEQQGRASCQDIGFSRGTYFKSGQQKFDSTSGFLSVKSGSNSQSSILQQLVLSNSCPNSRVVTLQCTDCGNRLNSSTASGHLAPVGSWPWQVSLQVSGSHRCGGVVISPNWIITAAHCMTRTPDAGEWAVYAGIVDPLGPLFNPAYAVSRIINHEGFNSLTRQNDIALLKLSRPLNGSASSITRPVCLPNDYLNISVPEKSWITYFGPSTNGDSASSYLMEAQVSLIDREECNSSTAYNGRISQDMLCVRGTGTGGSMCNSDGGNPLMSLKYGLWWLTGDKIWGENCTGQNKPGVYGNVTHHLKWIYHQMKKHQDA